MKIQRHQIKRLLRHWFVHKHVTYVSALDWLVLSTYLFYILSGWVNRNFYHKSDWLCINVSAMLCYRMRVMVYNLPLYLLCLFQEFCTFTLRLNQSNQFPKNIDHFFWTNAQIQRCKIKRLLWHWFVNKLATYVSTLEWLILSTYLFCIISGWVSINI